jgi:hypothetical protein
VILLLANLIGAVAAIAVGGTFYLGLLVMAICFIVFAPPAAFVLQYWVGYGACAHQSSIRYVLFFLSYFIGILFDILMFVGVPNAGGAGLISAITLVTTSDCSSGGCVGVGVFLFILAGLWILNGLLRAVMILLMIRYEFVSHVLIQKNRHYRQDNGSLSDIKSSITGFFAKKGLQGAVGV